MLVVEDNALVTSALRILLEDAGFRVSTASRVGEAYEVCRSDQPDVVLLDLRLPDGDGLTLLTRLRADGGFVPVVAALTGRDEPEVRERCRRAGCVDVLVKPVDVRSLGTLVRSWLAAPQSPA
ncbi:MAG TPA: response regulator [Gemmatimonadaceae bacterium]|nr:response regulator [Gemmatimonadaceae bacterium]